jgi:phospholipid/cholesterol/gamma-HCH transport system permease protein
MSRVRSAYRAWRGACLGDVTATQGSAAAAPRARYAVEAQQGAIKLRGDLRMPDATDIWRKLSDATSSAQGRTDFDLSGARVIDGGVMSLIVQLRAELAERGVACEIRGANSRVEQLVGLYGGDEKPVRRKKRKPEGFVENVGRTTAAVLGEGRNVIEFVGNFASAMAGIVRRPKTGNWADTIPIIERAGADAVPIIILINFLVGFVMGYQSANQLKQYGANIFVADLVGISVTRELAPLMTAIIVCGRSGAAFTAELGSMKVSEEIDALRTIGLGPVRYLVLPRVLALVLVTPVLTLFGDVVSVFGGLVVGVLSLDLGVRAYVNQTLLAVHGWDVLTGLIKSVVFGLAIALIACQQGFATSGGAEGVGRRTTSTVVTCLFAIVIIDSLFTVLYRILDI